MTSRLPRRFEASYSRRLEARVIQICRCDLMQVPRKQSELGAESKGNRPAHNRHYVRFVP